MVVKSCLKRASYPSSPQPETVSDFSETKAVYAERRKSVTFSAEGEEDIKEEVFYADDWDRSPIEMTRKLNYRDMLELMELRLSLPRIRLPGRQRSGSTDSAD